MIALLTVFFINASSTPGPTGANGNMGGTGPTGPSGQTGSFSLQGGKTVSFTAINFVGNQEISSAQLQNLANPFLNRSFSESDLYELKQRIVLLYQSKGYQDVQVTIPAMQTGSSTLTIVIQEGKKS